MANNLGLGSLLRDSVDNNAPVSSAGGLGSLLADPVQATPTASEPVTATTQSPASIDEFVSQVRPAAERVAKRLNVPVEAVIGQWGLETGWGKSVINGTNNLGNIKSTNGNGVAATDNMTGSRDKYRQYGSVDEFADDFTNLLGNGRYRGVAGSKDAQSYFAGLKAGGYAEDPDYVAKGSKAAQMARDVLGRVAPTEQQAAKPDLKKAKPWKDVVANPEFSKLPPEKKAEVKAAYFDYWIAPHGGTAEHRAKFLAQSDELGLWDKTKQAAKNIGSEIIDTLTPAPSIAEQAAALPAKTLPTDSFAPVKPEMRAAFNAAWDAATPEQRAQMQGREDWMGQLARARSGQMERFDQQAEGMPSAKMVDTRAEGRRARMVAAGEDPRYAETAATLGAQAGTAPGMEGAAAGTVQKSEFDFDTRQAFKQQGMDNPLVRGVAKGGLGIVKAAEGYTEFMGDVFGIDGMAASGKRGGAWAAGKEQAIGEQGTFLERNFEGAISSIAQQLPLLLGGAAMQSMALPLAGIALQTFGQEYSDGKRQGQDALQATTRASMMAAFEVIGERFGLSEQLKALRGMTRGMPTNEIFDLYMRALAKEIPGEMLTTTGQFGTDKLGGGVGLNPEAGLREYAKQMADTIAQTVMQSGMMLGGTTGVARATDFMRGVKSERAAETDAEIAKQRALDAWAGGLGGQGMRRTPDGRLEPTLSAPMAEQSPATAPEAGTNLPPAPKVEHQTSQDAQAIVAELAQSAGIPLDTVLPTPPATAAGDDAELVMAMAGPIAAQLQAKEEAGEELSGSENEFLFAFESENIAALRPFVMGAQQSSSPLAAPEAALPPAVSTPAGGLSISEPQEQQDAQPAQLDAQGDQGQGDQPGGSAGNISIDGGISGGTGDVAGSPAPGSGADLAVGDTDGRTDAVVPPEGTLIEWDTPEGKATGRVSESFAGKPSVEIESHPTMPKYRRMLLPDNWREVSEGVTNEALPDPAEAAEEVGKKDLSWEEMNELDDLGDEKQTEMGEYNYESSAEAQGFDPAPVPAEAPPKTEKEARERRNGKGAFASTNRFNVETEDNGTFEAAVHRTPEGDVVIQHSDGLIEHNAAFAQGKTDEELLRYSFEPLGYIGATSEQQQPAQSPAQSPAPDLSPYIKQKADGRWILAKQPPADLRDQIIAEIDKRNSQPQEKDSGTQAPQAEQAQEEKPQASEPGGAVEQVGPTPEQARQNQINQNLDKNRDKAVQQTAGEWHKDHVAWLIKQFKFSEADAKAARKEPIDWAGHQDFLETALENGEQIPQRVIDDYRKQGIQVDSATWPKLAELLKGDAEVSDADIEAFNKARAEASDQSFGDKPKTEKEAKERESWWKGLTPYGRRLVIDAAGIKSLPDSVYWHNIADGVKDMLWANRGAVETAAEVEAERQRLRDKNPLPTEDFPVTQPNVVSGPEVGADGTAAAETAKPKTERESKAKKADTTPIDASSMSYDEVIDALADGKRLTRDGETVWVYKVKNTYVMHRNDDAGEVTKGPIGGDVWDARKAAEKAISQWEFNDDGTAAAVEQKPAEQPKESTNAQETQKPEPKVQQRDEPAVVQVEGEKATEQPAPAREPENVSVPASKINDIPASFIVKQSVSFTAKDSLIYDPDANTYIDGDMTAADALAAIDNDIKAMNDLLERVQKCIAAGG